MKNVLDLKKERVAFADLFDGVEAYALSYKDLVYVYECLNFSLL